jgi:hypothetical protein
MKFYQKNFLMLSNQNHGHQLILILFHTIMKTVSNPWLMKLVILESN